MPSTADFETYFSPAARERGAELYGEKVVEIEPRHNGWVGKVGGEDASTVIIDVSIPGDEVLHCTCPDYAEEPPCAHLWAALLDISQRDRMAQLEADTAALPSRAKYSWRGRLENLKSSGEEQPPPPPAFEGEVAYLIDVVESYHCNGLVLQPVLQKRLLSGELGKPRRLDVDSHDFASLSSLDRQIVTLVASRPVQDVKVVSWQELRPANAWVPNEVLPVILPSLQSTGRVYAWNRRAGESALPKHFGKPVQIDLESDAVVSVRHRREEASQRVRIQAELRVDGVELELSPDPLLFGDGYVLDRGHLFALASLDKQGLGTILIRDGAIEVPTHEESSLLAALMSLPGASALKSDHLEMLDGVDPVPHLDLLDPPDPSSKRSLIEGKLRFEYGTVEVPLDDTRTLFPVDGGKLLRRDTKREQLYLDQFSLLGGLLPNAQFRQHPALPMKRFEPIVLELTGSGWRISVRGKKLYQSPTPSFSVKSNKDWFEIDVEVRFGNTPLRLPQLLETIQSGSNTVRLDDGSVGILPGDWLQSWMRLFGLGEEEDGRIRLQANQAWVFDALLGACPSAEYSTDADFRSLRDALASAKEVKPKKPPRSFSGELRPYQQRGLGWLHHIQALGLGGCLADDMGLGKTIQVLALLESRRNKKKDKRPSLIVVPSSLVFNWRQEAERFTPEMRVLDFSGTKRWRDLAEIDEDIPRAFAKHDLVITTYGTLRRDIARYAEFSWDYVVLDESQAIKNNRSQASKAVRILRARHRLALSGTPIENHFGELWALFEFLNPGMLGRSTVFQDMLKMKDSVPEAERLAALDQLGRALSPFILRRKKSEVLDDLPDKTELTLHCELPAEQRKSYDELRLHYQRVLLKDGDKEDLKKNKIHVLEALLRLRQAACHPGLIDKRREAETCGKFEVLLPMLQELAAEGHKALVFSQFPSLFQLLKPKLEALDLTYEYLDGRTRKRQERVERFQSDPDCPLFLISIKAGGHGLNLTAADYVFILDPWWNPAVEAQAVDRAHRIGQTQKVMAYRLLCRDTVEEHVAQLQAEKRQLADAILNADRSLMQALTPEDLAILLG